tara:strand:- start:486 stop:710 length:225 start_codon:yes stop_codon:yes gene_type:complete
LLKRLKSFQNIVQQAAPAASASYSLIASILIFTFLGKYIDSKFEISPLGVLTGVLIGLAVGFYQLIKITHINKK